MVVHILWIDCVEGMMKYDKNGGAYFMDWLCWRGWWNMGTFFDQWVKDWWCTINLWESQANLKGLAIDILGICVIDWAMFLGLKCPFTHDKSYFGRKTFLSFSFIFGLSKQEGKNQRVKSQVITWSGLFENSKMIDWNDQISLSEFEFFCSLIEHNFFVSNWEMICISHLSFILKLNWICLIDWFFSVWEGEITFCFEDRVWIGWLSFECAFGKVSFSFHCRWQTWCQAKTMSTWQGLSSMPSMLIGWPVQSEKFFIVNSWAEKFSLLLVPCDLWFLCFSTNFFKEWHLPLEWVPVPNMMSSVWSCPTFVIVIIFNVHIPTARESWWCIRFGGFVAHWHLCCGF